MRFFLLRHACHDDVGRVLSGRCGNAAGLNAIGRSQAERLARMLAKAGIATIHSSPQRRAIETATMIARTVRRKIRIVDALDEIDFGRWTGRPFATLEREPLWRQWNAARSTCSPPGGETMGAAVARATHHLESWMEGGEGPRLCVTHGDIIRGVIAHYLDMPLDAMLRLEAEPASLTVLDLTRSGARIAAMNRVPA